MVFKIIILDTYYVFLIQIKKREDKNLLFFNTSDSSKTKKSTIKFKEI